MQSVLASAHCPVAERAEGHQFCLGGEVLHQSRSCQKRGVTHGRSFHKRTWRAHFKWCAKDFNEQAETMHVPAPCEHSLKIQGEGLLESRGDPIWEGHPKEECSQPQGLCQEITCPEAACSFFPVTFQCLSLAALNKKPGGQFISLQGLWQPSGSEQLTCVLSQF